MARWVPNLAQSTSIVESVRDTARPLSSAEDLDALLDAIGDVRYVMLGEASHGTSEYYAWRTRLSQRLIEEKGFSFIAVEGDWPDCYRINRYIKGYQDSGGSAFMAPETCEKEVVDLLIEMQKAPSRFDGDPEAAFNAEQNALVLRDAERYYRAMVRSDQNSWNVRDIHMADTLDRLMEHHSQLYDRPAKAIVWAHNTHVGDARATDMAQEGMVNIGQLARERHGSGETVLIGFGSHHGTVVAGQEWGAPMEVMGVPDASEGSWEDLLHRAGEAFYLLLQEHRQDEIFLEDRGHRAIGVVYNPNHERFGNYVPTRLPERYDAFLFIDETRALHPLHIEVEEEKEMPETYPWGM